MTADVSKHLDTVRKWLIPACQHSDSYAWKSLDALAAALAEKDAEIERMRASRARHQRANEKHQGEVEAAEATVRQLRSGLEEAIERGKSGYHGMTKAGRSRKGCNLKQIHGCYWCRAAAALAASAGDDATST